MTIHLINAYILLSLGIAGMRYGVNKAPSSYSETHTDIGKVMLILVLSVVVFLFGMLGLVAIGPTG